RQFILQAGAQSILVSACGAGTQYDTIGIDRLRRMTQAYGILANSGRHRIRSKPLRPRGDACWETRMASLLEPLAHSPAPATQARPRVRGKFLFLGEAKLSVRGGTYGT